MVFFNMLGFSVERALIRQMDWDRSWSAYPEDKSKSNKDWSEGVYPPDMLKDARNILKKDTPSDFFYQGHFSKVFWLAYFSGIPGVYHKASTTVLERAEVHRDAHLKLEENANMEARISRGLRRLDRKFEAWMQRRSVKTYNKRIARLQRAV